MQELMLTSMIRTRVRMCVRESVCVSVCVMLYARSKPAYFLVWLFSLTSLHTQTHPHNCVCVCVEREREREREIHICIHILYKVSPPCTYNPIHTRTHALTNEYVHTDSSFPVSFFELVAATECARGGDNNQLLF
jgi:hypothetical protein